MVVNFCCVRLHKNRSDSIRCGLIGLLKILICTVVIFVIVSTVWLMKTWSCNSKFFINSTKTEVEFLSVTLPQEKVKLPLSSIKPTNFTPPNTNRTNTFSVAENGFWEGLQAKNHHAHDEPLSAALVKFLKSEKANSLIDLCAGMGLYSKAIKSSGILTSCYDGNPDTQNLTEGRCGVLDLSKPLDLSSHDWVLSFEVGEHIPQQFENTFLDNLNKANKNGMIISWAIVGQGGMQHVNCRNNDYIRGKLSGYSSDLSAETVFRNQSTRFWFKNTIMVFGRKSD